MKPRARKEVGIVKMPIYLSDADHKALRIAAIEERKSATAIIRELVSDYLAKRRRKGGK